MAESTSTNNAPVAPAAVAMEVSRDSSAVPVALDVHDPDGDPLIYSVKSATWPTYGSLWFDDAAGAFYYEPLPGFTGTESFTAIIYDGRGGSVEQVVTITVGEPAPGDDNQAPVAPATIVVGIDEDTVAYPVYSEASDPDGDPLSYDLDPDHYPLNGRFWYDDSSAAYYYEPLPDFSGTDSFTVIISDGRGGVVRQTVTINVAPVNDAPVPAAGLSTVEVAFGSPVSITLPAGLFTDPKAMRSHGRSRRARPTG
jgi:hypothetical protein